MILYSDGRQRAGANFKWKARRFQFEPFWAKEEESKQVVYDIWKSSEDRVNVMAKLVEVSQGFQSWNFSNLVIFQGR